MVFLLGTADGVEVCKFCLYYAVDCHPHLPSLSPSLSPSDEPSQLPSSAPSLTQSIVDAK